MADISNITLPNGDNYNLKDLVARTIGGSMDILLTKTYTGVIGTGTTAALSNLYAIKVLPDNYNNSWEIVYKVTSTIAGVSEANGSGYEDSYVRIVGMRNSFSNYLVVNNIRSTSYRPYFYHPVYFAKEAGITSEYGHIIGIGLRSSWHPDIASNTRTVKFDILDYKNCNIEFFDLMMLYEDVPGTGTTNYNSLSEFNGSTAGYTRTGTDNNNYDRTLISSNAVRCGSTAIAAANVIVGDSEGLYKHLKTGTAFDIRFPILYAYSAAGANALVTNIYLSYPFAVATTQAITLTQAAPVYIKGSLSGSTFTPISTTPLTQTLPSTEDGYEYIRLGYAYSTTALWLEPVHPIFAYRNGVLREVGGDADSVEGKTVRNNTTKGSIGWTSAAESIQLLTQNDIAYWNGRYNSSSSNLKYAEVGELKDAATYEVETAVADDAKLPTGAAVKAFVEGKGYVTTDTKNTAGSTDTSSKIFLVGATSQADNPQTYSDNEVYATDGKLSMKEAQIGGDSGPIARYNVTTKSLDFVFS